MRNESSNTSKRSADVVLLQLPFWGVGCPPLGPALLKSYLAQNGISCKVFDINAHAYSIRGKRYFDWWELKNGYYFFQGDEGKMLEYYRDNRALFLFYIGEIIKLSPKVVGCSCHNTSITLSKIFLGELKNYLPNCKYILGGPEVAGFMNNADQLLSEDYIDAVALDEGEKSLVGYFRGLEEDSEGPIPGLVYKKDGRIIEGGEVDIIGDLDELPFPDFSEFNLEHYYKPNSLPSYTSRGCVNRCIYCSGRTYMKRFRNRSGKRIFEEFKYLKEHYPEADYIRLCDNVSNGDIKKLESLCDHLTEADLGISWTLDNAVIRKEMRAPLYKKLKKAGCTLIGYGLETPCHRILENIGKHFSRGVDFVKVFKEGKKAGIYISVNVMFGLPGETEEDFRYMINFVVKNRRAFNMLNPSLTFCEFYPGSAGYDEPGRFDLDMAKGSLFWESVDGANNYLVRMRRFEEFCKVLNKYKYDTLFYVKELPNKHALLFEYYFISNEYDKAMEHYGKIPLDQINAKVKEIYRKINGKSVPGTGEKKLRLSDFIEKDKTFEESFLEVSLAEAIEQLQKTDVFELGPKKAWKRKLRSFAHRVIGYDRIEERVSSVYSMMKLIDAKINCYAAAAYSHKNGIGEEEKIEVKNQRMRGLTG